MQLKSHIELFWTTMLIFKTLYVAFLQEFLFPKYQKLYTYAGHKISYSNYNYYLLLVS